MNNEELKQILEGGWQLDNWYIEYADGKQTFPFGEDAIGLIIYASDGTMSATISKNNRAKLDASNPRHVDDSTKADLYDSFFHYSGTWEVIDGSAHHNLMLALNPNMKDTIQIRAIDLSDNNQTLVLSAKEDTANKQRTHNISWKRNLQK